MKKLPLALLFLCCVFPAALCTTPINASAAPAYQRSLERYTVPDVTLIDQDGKRVKFAALVNSGKPVVLDFIYGTCTTICPVLSAGYTNFQRKLGADTRSVQLISISIDPENDTPAVMKKYLKNYRSQPGWDFLTGSREDIDRVMRAFNAYIPNKMDHYPIMFLKASGDEAWVRIYGLIGTADFLKEYAKVVQQ
ncbi:MAG: SCO family protein [Nitrospirota bacterium]